MQNDKLDSYISLAFKAGYVIAGSDELEKYDKKLYLVLLNKSAGKSARKIYDRLVAKGIEGREVDSLSAVNGKEYKLIGIKNKGLSEQITKQIN